MEKTFQQHAITYTGHWFSEKKNSQIKNLLLNLHVLSPEIFTLKAYNSAKKLQMTEIYEDVNQGTRFYRFMKKPEIENFMLLSL